MGEVSLWDFFNKLSDCDGPKAECRMCSRVLACSTSANLKVHLQRKHGDTINVQRYLGKQRENKSNVKECATKTLVWRNFTKVEGDKFACCNLCSKIISYKSTIWNLKTHLKLVHVDIYPMLIALALEEDEQCVKVPENAENDEEDVASYFSEETGGHMRCSVCNQTVSPDQRRSHLEEQHQYQQHARRKHDLGPRADDAEDSEERQGESKQKFSRPKRSIVWLYFTCVDPDAKVSQCNICKKLLSHRSSVTNLKQHLEMKHPNLKISVRKHRSSDGELYGVDTGTKLEDADDGNNDQDIQTKDAVYTEIIYLEEEDQELNLSRKKEKEPKYNTRSSKTPKSNSKPTRKRRKTIETSSEPSDEEYNPDYSTDEEYRPDYSTEKKSVNKETDELEKFGSYIASLLRTVPKKSRTKLQMEIVNRIMTEKLKLEDSDDSSIKSAGKEKGTRLISVVEEISKMNTSEVTATEASM